MNQAHLLWLRSRKPKTDTELTAACFKQISKSFIYSIFSIFDFKQFVEFIAHIHTTLKFILNTLMHIAQSHISSRMLTFYLNDLLSSPGDYFCLVSSKTFSGLIHAQTKHKRLDGNLLLTGSDYNKPYF